MSNDVEPVVDLSDLCRSIAGRAASGEQIEVYAARTSETDIDVFDGAIESLSVAGTSGIGIRVIADHRQGFAWAGSLDPDVVAETLTEARDNARFGEPDEFYGLVDTTIAQSHAYVDLDLWDDALQTVDLETKIAFVLGLDVRVRSADVRIRAVESTSYGDGLIESAIANSLGVAASTRRTLASASSVAIAGVEGDTQTGYGFSVGRSYLDVNPDDIVAMAVEKSTRLLGAKQPKGRRIPVLFDPMVTASFLGVLSAAFNAESMLKGRSLFQDRAGTEVAASLVSLRDDPTDSRSLGASPYDAEGVACQANDLIVDGVMQGFLHNTYTARRAGTATTASAVRGGFRSTPGVGVRSMRFGAGTRSASEVAASVPEALYVQAVHGIHSGTNPISGDFSVGAEGIMIRDGAYCEPVRELTIASTVPKMLLGIQEVASDAIYLPSGTVGVSILIDDMALSGA